MAVMQTSDVDLDVVLRDPRALFRLRVLRAARSLLAEQGLGVSMNDIAAAAGVGRRSLFRHFDSRDALVAQVFSDALDVYHASLLATTEAHLRVTDPPFETWLETLVEHFQAAVTEIGLAYWQMTATPDHDLPPVLAALNQRRRAARRDSTAAIARAAWQRAGGHGAVPKVVENAVALTISSFAHRSMIDDYGSDPTTTSRTVATLLARLIEDEVRDTSASGA
jgi:AcrR family transcriptional regulator